MFLGGDLLPSGLYALTSDETVVDDFIEDFLVTKFLNLKKKMGKQIS